jgi:hypothetical protein
VTEKRKVGSSILPLTTSPAPGQQGFTSANASWRRKQPAAPSDRECPLLTGFRRTLVHVECTRGSPRQGGFMPRGMVALLAAVAAGLTVLATLTHGALLRVTAAGVAGAAGLVAYVTSAAGSTGSGIFKKITLCRRSASAKAPSHPWAA